MLLHLCPCSGPALHVKLWTRCWRQAAAALQSMQLLHAPALALQPGVCQACQDTGRSSACTDLARRAQVLDATVEIPMQGVIRSLNAHVSGGIAMYEVARQQQTACTPAQPT